MVASRKNRNPILLNMPPSNNIWIGTSTHPGLSFRHERA